MPTYLVLEKGYINNEIKQPGDTFVTASPIKGSWFKLEKSGTPDFDDLPPNQLRIIAEERNIPVSEKDNKASIVKKLKAALAAEKKIEDEDIA